MTSLILLCTQRQGYWEWKKIIFTLELRQNIIFVKRNKKGTTFSRDCCFAESNNISFFVYLECKQLFKETSYCSEDPNLSFELRHHRFITLSHYMQGTCKIIHLSNCNLNDFSGHNSTDSKQNFIFSQHFSFVLVFP